MYSPPTMTDFRNCVANSGLHELSKSGISYIWSNQQMDNLIKCKLDSSLWVDSFPRAFYRSIHPLSSDHSPFIIFMQEHTKIHHRFLLRNYWTTTNSTKILFHLHEISFKMVILYLFPLRNLPRWEASLKVTNENFSLLKPNYLS